MKNAILLTDGYKLDHRRQYPEGTEYVYSTWIPRSNTYLPQAKGAVVFGVQYLIKKHLIEEFDNNFFNRPKAEVINEYKVFVSQYLNVDTVDVEHIEELHDLGYLPIKIKALPEGSVCPIKVPALTIINTLPRFFWITNFLETLISNTLWLPMTSATIAKVYKDELVRHAEKTGFADALYLDFLCHDFSMRGMSGLDATLASGMAHLTSFSGSESIPSILEARDYYGDGVIAGTVSATEHSVMCAGGCDDELATFRRLITEIYPSGFVSIVSDTWDFWKVMTEYTVALKNEILARDGRVVFRPDSGCPEDIICGREILEDYAINMYDGLTLHNGKYYDECYYDDRDGEYIYGKEVMPTSSELKGAYEVLWDIFGGTINEQGYKVLNPKVGIIYGDSITMERQAEIYRRLEEKGFAATNLVLGIGSYTYQYKTRDSLGFAMKATWCQINGEAKEIFKQPKTDDGTKNSLKGLCYVQQDDVYGDFEVIDQCNKQIESAGELRTVFENGKLIKEVSFKEIKERLCKH